MNRQTGSRRNNSEYIIKQALKESIENKENIPQSIKHRRNSSTKVFDFSFSKGNQKQSLQQKEIESFHMSNFSTNTQFSTYTFDRKSSDTESVIYLGDKDIQVKRSQDLQGFQDSQQNRFQLQEVNLSMSMDSLERNQNVRNQIIQKNEQKSSDSTFRLSISGDFRFNISSVKSSFQKNPNQINHRPIHSQEQNQELSQKQETLSTENSSDLFLYCNQCKGLKKAELFSKSTNQKWKSGFLNVITDIFCCFNKSKNLEKGVSSTGFRCLVCRNFNVMLNDLKMENC